TPSIAPTDGEALGQCGLEIGGSPCDKTSLNGMYLPSCGSFSSRLSVPIPCSRAPVKGCVKLRPSSRRVSELPSGPSLTRSHQLDRVFFSSSRCSSRDCSGG